LFGNFTDSVNELLVRRDDNSLVSP
jgi:hypothetical protein